MENNELGASPASQDRATGLRPQPPEAASRSSVPDAAQLETALLAYHLEPYREIAQSVAQRFERTFTGPDADLAGSIGESHMIFGTACAHQAAEELRDMQTTFDLRWKADMRAIKRWQDATGRPLTWPDHADLVVWLLEQLDAASAIEGEAEDPQGLHPEGESAARSEATGDAQ